MTGAGGAAGRPGGAFSAAGLVLASAPGSRLRRDRPRDSAVNVPTPTIRTNAAQMTMMRTSSMTGRDYRWRRP